MGVTWKRLSGETENGYIYRICSNKEAIGTWYDVADILNAELGREWNESAYRKKYQSGKAFLEEKEDELFESESYIEKMRKEREELQRERIKLQTEKLEYNKWLREHARDELFEEKIVNSIYEVLGTVPSPKAIPSEKSERCAVLALADQHYAKQFTIKNFKGEIINEYSPEIFEERMNRLLGDVIEYCDKEDIKYLKVFTLGDCLDGLLRNSQIWSLRYSVTDAAIKYADYMAKWFMELSNHVGVEVHSALGNHTELRLLDGRKGEHLSDNMEKVVNRIIQVYNKDNPNFELIENESGYIFTEAAGFNLMGIHGEVSDPAKAISEFSDLYDTKIEWLIYGHLHHASFKNCGVRRGIIGVGSIMGSDDFSMKIRRSADASASLIIFEKGKGKVDEHTFVLN